MPWKTEQGNRDWRNQGRENVQKGKMVTVLNK